MSDKNTVPTYIIDKINEIIDLRTISLPDADLSDNECFDEYSAVGIKKLSDLLNLLIQDDIKRALKLNIEECNLSKSGLRNIQAIINEKTEFHIDVFGEAYPQLMHVIAILDANLDDYNVEEIRQKVINYVSWKRISECVDNSYYSDDYSNQCFREHEGAIRLTKEIFKLIDAETPAYLHIFSNEIIFILKEMLSRIGEFEQTLFIKHYLCNMSYEEIAMRIFSYEAVQHEVNKCLSIPNERITEIIYPFYIEGVSINLEKVVHFNIARLRHYSKRNDLKKYYELIKGGTPLNHALADMYEIKPDFSKEELISFYILDGFKKYDPIALGKQMSEYFSNCQPMMLNDLIMNEKQSWLQLVSYTASGELRWHMIKEEINAPKVFKQFFPEYCDLSNDDIFGVILELNKILFLVRARLGKTEQYYRLFYLIYSSDSIYSSLDQSFKDRIQDSVEKRIVRLNIPER